MRIKGLEKVGEQLRDHRDCVSLTGITLEHLPRDASLGRVRQYERGSFIWTSGSADHKLYFLKRGQVVIMLTEETGCEVIVNVIKPGGPFGELCFCAKREQPRQNCAQASVDSAVLEVGFEEFMMYLQRDARALAAFAFTFCKRLADAESRIEVLSHRGAEARLGRLLLQLATDGLARSNLSRVLPLTVGHDELARMAAMTRPHVSVTMGKLRALGLVHYGRNSQLRVDVVRLTEYVNGRAIPATQTGE